ncbi:hypothetical protein PG608_11825 [Riemerella anatipestifer]|uniref:hypothetical protein n=1 Tax=Riemerella anatipestifer TaxID=34085 RepID=UPI0007EC3E58|nr:hypothetical protein [Riemerella anatipestifer]AZZ59406.1 hypothetical protein AWB57_10465 [Riemerella anatipestifer]MCW0510394.1 hypothetical protein [Riemerella anatipestifer]MDR7695277.1 hypothetical protein [Riemerella anatipestifer]MDR7795447.1 hypothetical protein [Riemerella anatipestifer]MDY3390118.1 hypothetical protein [Riemerella anatipestifer]
MKTTATKLSVLAFLGLGLVAYGQSGKVGINTGKPAATLEVQPTSTNLAGTTNEGFIAPKLSKTRIAAIASPVEGTLVYATDEADSKISDYTGTDTKVAKITEKGYYYYNGTEWVKSAAGTYNEIWKENKFMDGSILRREVILPFLDSEGEKRNGITASFQSTDKLNELGFSLSAYGIGMKRYNNSISPTALVLERLRGTIDAPTAIQKDDVLGQIYFRVGDPMGTFSGDRNASFFRSSVLEYNDLNSFSSELAWGVRRTTDSKPYFAMFLSPDAGLGIGNKATDERLLVRGTPVHQNIVKFKSDTNIDAFWITNQSHTYTRSFTVLGEGAVGSVINIENNSKTGATQANRWMWFNAYDATPTDPASAYREGLHLWSYNTDDSAPSSGPKLIIRDNGNVGIGGAYAYKINPDIDEKLVVGGSIKSTALAGNGLKSVMADENGKLVVGTSTTALGLWTNDANNNLARLATTSDGTTARTNDNRVTIADDGAVTAKGFMGYSGATTFPDYVFQKYYTGTSSLKADYSFKTLSQVEDFVKTNGHLPGYQSAEAIKKQGYIDLMATQLTNVEKIEELYLHLLEKDKEVKELKARLEKLEALLAK